MAPVVFSPFQTVLHLECPVKRILAAKENWVPRRIEQRDISSLLGVAIAAGLEHHNKGLPDPKARALQHAQDVADSGPCFTAPCRSGIRANGTGCRPAPKAAVFAYTSLPDMLPGKVVAVEANYGPSGGYARPDLLRRRRPACPGAVRLQDHAVVWAGPRRMRNGTGRAASPAGPTRSRCSCTAGSKMSSTTTSA